MCIFPIIKVYRLQTEKEPSSRDTDLFITAYCVDVNRKTLFSKVNCNENCFTVQSVCGKIFVNICCVSILHTTLPSKYSPCSIKCNVSVMLYSIKDD